MTTNEIVRCTSQRRKQFLVKTSAFVFNAPKNHVQKQVVAFLENCRAENLAKSRRQRGRISELYSIQNKAFKDAWNGVSIVQVEEYWKKYVLEDMVKKFKKDPSMYYWAGEYHLRKRDAAAAEVRFKKAIAPS